MAVTATYCTMTDIYNRLTRDGAALRLDDPAFDGRDEHGDVIDEAAAIVDEHCYSRYGANLTLSRQVHHWATSIAACLLCERRGNPAPMSTAKREARAMKSMERVLLYGGLISDIAELKSSAPVLSNLHTQMVPFPHTVVETSGRRSTGSPAGYTQNRDNLDRWVYDYVITWLLAPLACWLASVAF